MQYSWFDEEDRLKKIEELGDSLQLLNKVVDWKAFCPILDEAIPRGNGEKGGRPPFSNLLMFKVLVIKRLFNLSHDQTEYQINDRISFMRFLGLGMGDRIPDAKTIWAYEDMLAKAGMAKKLFEQFHMQILGKGLITREGSIVDATFIEAPKRKNTSGQRETLKRGTVPEEWDDPVHPQKLMQRDIDASWTKKGGVSHFGYKDTVKVDADSKLITAYSVDTACTNDGKAAENIFTEDDKVAYGDAAYPNIELPTGVENKICEKANRNHPLTEEQKIQNHKKAKIRCRVEHVFAGMVQNLGGTQIRCKNHNRASFNIGLLNLLYNMCRVRTLTNLQTV